MRGDRARLVEHLAAKATIDVLVGIDDPDDEPAYLPDLAARPLADREWRDMNYDAEAKHPVITAILERAGWSE